MATTSRALWKGAISFGLVHIPVSLHSATTEHGIDFDWLDKRTLDPVGYKRINKKTGKAIDKNDIVRGVAYQPGDYAVLTDEEIASEYPASTQTIDIEAFVRADEIPFVFLDRPYCLAPVAKGERVYALLREALAQSQRIGVARVVIQTKQHLAALMTSGPALVLVLLRWATDIRPLDDLPLPAEGSKATGLTARELQMAAQLIDDMTGAWDPQRYHDSFKDEVMALVEEKVKTGQLKAVSQPAAEQPVGGAEVIDLAELLKRSLRGKDAADASPAKAPTRKAPARRAPSKAAKATGATGVTASKQPASASAGRTDTGARPGAPMPSKTAVKEAATPRSNTAAPPARKRRRDAFASPARRRAA